MHPALRIAREACNPGYKTFAAIRRVSYSHQSSSMQHKVAVLYQALDPPIINGVQKPKKPGGYQDSGADIAYVLKNICNIPVVTPAPSPDPKKDDNWCFPDHEEGILSAIKQGATHLWANTILFATHPLQSSAALDSYADDVSVVGQPPKLVEAYDDKALVYNIMKTQGGNLTLPNSITVTKTEDYLKIIQDQGIRYPFVAKPVRGRGSHGVKLCTNEADFEQHAKGLFDQSPKIIIEEYLAGEEATVTVMPPSKSRPEYWAMPIITRFNHIDGIAPYNGVVAVTANSRVVTELEEANDAAYKKVANECTVVAEILKTTAPIRIDVRRFSEGSDFALFDVNMKPNMTGPGRPGREDQASLTAMAAKSLGWDYGQLLEQILKSSSSLQTVRNIELPPCSK